MRPSALIRARPTYLRRRLRLSAGNVATHSPSNDRRRRQMPFHILPLAAYFGYQVVKKLAVDAAADKAKQTIGGRK